MIKDVPDIISAKWVLAQVEAIKKCTGDPEGAHSMEDDLYEIVLQKIAALNVTDVGSVAMAALKTKDIDFPRWCA